MHGHTGSFSLFTGISLAGILMGGIFFLFWWRISTIYHLRWQPRMLILLAGVSITMLVLAFFLRDNSIPLLEKSSTVIIGIVYCMWTICFLLILQHIASLFISIPAWIMSVLMVGYLGVGFYFGTQTKITELTITSSKIEKNLNVLFISDFHVNSLRHTKYIQSIVDRIQTIKPDIVLLGGDLLDMPNKDFPPAFLPFDQLSMPVYATLGNHDAMGNQTVALDIFSLTKIIPLRNQSIMFSGIQIVGIDDKSYWSGEKLDDIIQESQITDGKYTIFISHQPQKLDKLANYPIDLELAGHTHAGQIPPMNWLIGLFNDYSYGKYQSGDRVAFVSQGIGTWGAPVRIGTMSEMVLIKLEKK